MGWIKEFGRQFRVPKQVSSLVRQGLLYDRSWRNDVAPSFGVNLKGGLIAVLWVDHPSASRREFPENKRYLVVLEDRQGRRGYPKDVVNTDSLKKALGAVRNLVHKYEQE